MIILLIFGNMFYWES